MLTAPFPRGHLADPFGDWPQWRKDMGLGPHRGADWNELDAGTPIPASGVGRVVWRTDMTDAEAERTALGHQIQIAYPVQGGEIRIGYSHLHRNPTLKVGDAVRLRQAVGLLGNSGTASTGAHLHMTASWTTGDPGWIAVVDPVQFLTFGSSPAGGAASLFPPGIRANRKKDTMQLAYIPKGAANGKDHLFLLFGERFYVEFVGQAAANAFAEQLGAGAAPATRSFFDKVARAQGITQKVEVVNLEDA